MSGEAGLTWARADAMLFFYQNGCLAVLMDDEGPERVLRSGRLPLAQSGTIRTQLMATDVSTSVLGATSAHSGHQGLCYDPYGHGRVSGLELFLGFNGEHYVPLQKAYVLGNGERFYSPNLRRFCSPDKYGPFTSAGINGYAYCRGDPVNFVDPSGRIGVPTLRFQAGQKLGKMNGPAIDLQSAAMKPFYGGELTFGYITKRFRADGTAGLNSGMNHADLLGAKTASYFSKNFDKYTKKIAAENFGLVESVSARAVKNVINSIAAGTPSKHIFVSQSLPTTSQGRFVTSVYYTGMSSAHDRRLQAALSPFNSDIIQSSLPIRRMQPIPAVLESPDVQNLLKDIEIVRNTHG
jgi:RHS repeat-associated protein